MAAEAVADKEDRGWFKRINLFLLKVVRKEFFRVPMSFIP
jgi:hypothetical protein